MKQVKNAPGWYFVFAIICFLFGSIFTMITDGPHLLLYLGGLFLSIALWGVLGDELR